MPGDGLALAVQVGREVDFRRVLRRRPQFRNQLLARIQHHIGRLERMFHVHVQALFGHVAHVAHRGLYDVARPQVFVDGFGLGRGLDDDQCRAGAAFGGNGGGRVVGFRSCNILRQSMILHEKRRRIVGGETTDRVGY